MFDSLAKEINIMFDSHENEISNPLIANVDTFSFSNKLCISFVLQLHARYL